MSEQTLDHTLEQDLTDNPPLRSRWYPLTRLFHAPTLSVVDHGERRATWIELFFDLVFVVAVAALGHLLHDDPSRHGFTTFAWLFIPVWWSWMGFSYYADQFDNDDFRFRLVINGAMLGIILLAVNIDAAAHGRVTGFVLAYLLLRILLIGLYAWARRTVPAVRALCTYCMVGFSLGVLVWIFSLFAPESARYSLWALALLIEIATPVIAHIVPTVGAWQTSHMPERFGLFTLIVLGEAIVSVANGVGEVEWDWRAILTAVSGFLIATMLCWLYFGYADETMINRALHGSRATIASGFVYGYSHLLIFAAITAISAGIGLAIDEAHALVLEGGTRAALFGGMSVALVGMTVGHWVMPYGLEPSVVLVRLGVISLFVLLALAGGALPPVLLVSVLALAMMALILFEIFAWSEERDAMAA